MCKEISEMTIEELWELFPIVLDSHKPEYSNWYLIEENKIRDLISESDIYRISHVGSTAVDGLIAKPTIDILLELEVLSDVAAIIEKLDKSGWGFMDSKDEPYLPRSLCKGYTKYGFAEKVYHLHIRYAGDWDELYFRDYLRENSDVAEEYGRLKESLISEYRNNRDGYTNAKTKFIIHYTKFARKKYGEKYNL